MAGPADIDALRAEIAELRALVAELTTGASDVGRTVDALSGSDGRRTRRGMLAVAAGAGVGAVVAAVAITPQQAAATVTTFDGGSTIGVEGITAGAGQAGVSGIATDGIGAHGVAGTSAKGFGVYGYAVEAGQSGVYGATDGAGAFGVTGGSSNGDGVRGFTNAASRSGVFGSTTAPGAFGLTGASTNGDGVQGVTDAPGRSGVYGHTAAAGGFGVTGTSTNGVGVQGRTSAPGSAAVMGKSDADYGYGIDSWAIGANATGVRGYADGADATGVIGHAAAGLGGVFIGGRANIRLEAAGPPAPDRASTGHANLGDLVMDGNGDLWLGTSNDASQPTWVKLTEAATPLPAGGAGYHPVDPYRAYDSRMAEPQQGRLDGGSRVISIKDRRDLNTGALTLADVVPPGAAAVTYNLTAVDTGGAGFMSVEPGDAATYSASTVNFAAGQTIANASTVRIDGARQIKVFIQEGVSAHLIIDITGYYL